MRRTVLFLILLMVSLGCVGLGTWQLRRLSARRAQNAEAYAGRQLAVLSAADGRLPALRPNRRAVLAGMLDEEREFLLRGRVVQGVPAILVVTPLRAEGSDTAVLINRGYVPAPDAVDPGNAEWSEPGPRQFHGVLLPVPSAGDGAPVRSQSRETWKRLDLEAMRSRLPYPLAPVYLVAEPDSGSAEHTIRGRAYPFRAAAPPLDEGPHLMYAIQWFGIATAVLAFGIIFVLRGVPVPSSGIR